MSKGNTRLSWGILSTGKIAQRFAQALAASQTGELVAVGSRTQASADAFGEQFGVERRYASYQGALDDPMVQAVYIAPPHPMHAEWAVKAAEAGKHILVEKPIGINHAEAMAIVEAARENDVFLMEAFMYRYHPQIRKLIELLQAHEIGQVRMIDAEFAFQADANMKLGHRLGDPALGGGGILDVGCYCTSMARLIAGVALGKQIAEPIEITGTGHLNQMGVDAYAVASLKFPGGIVAKLSTGVQVKLNNAVRIFGSRGKIEMLSPWLLSAKGGESKMIVHRQGEAEPQELVIKSPGLYTLEADAAAKHLSNRQAAWPAMTWDDSLGNMQTLDTWRQQIGLVFPSERPDAAIPTVTRRPLQQRTKHNMRYGRIQGLTKRPVSRLVLGCDNQKTLAHASVMLDDYFSRGGNTFDTAWSYGRGLPEQLLGQWLRNRGVRSEVNIIAKGAHTPDCQPEKVGPQLAQSLDRLGVDHVEMYLLHRDNPQIPIGEFVDVLNEQRDAGHIGVFGGSNWSIERIAAANTYAREQGICGFSIVSNNFSLARMVNPVWAGCVSSSNATWRAWLVEQSMPVLAWSSQARGFFVDGRADPQDNSDAHLARTWYCDDNFERLARAKRLAAQRGVLTINIALAYVLSQPFMTFALIGPRALRETHTSLAALDVSLTPNELAWLNLDTDQP